MREEIIPINKYCRRQKFPEHHLSTGVAQKKNLRSGSNIRTRECLIEGGLSEESGYLVTVIVLKMPL